MMYTASLQPRAAHVRFGFGMAKPNPDHTVILRRFFNESFAKAKVNPENQSEVQIPVVDQGERDTGRQKIERFQAQKLTDGGVLFSDQSGKKVIALETLSTAETANLQTVTVRGSKEYSSNNGVLAGLFEDKLAELMKDGLKPVAANLAKEHQLGEVPPITFF